MNNSMSNNPREKYDLALLADKLEEIKTVGKENTVEFEVFQLKDITSVLQSSYDFSKHSFSDLESRQIISNGIFSAGKKGRISKSSLNEQINREKSKYLKKPFRK